LEVRNWVKDCCKRKGISSLIDLISRFIEYWRPNYQTYEDVLRDIAVVLEDKGFTTEIIEDLRKVHHAQDQELKEEIYEEGYQPLEEEEESPHDPIRDNEDLIEERVPEKVNHEEDHQVHEHEFPYGYSKEEHFDGTHLVEYLIHEEVPYEYELLVFAPSFDEVIQSSIPPTHEEANMVSYTPFHDFDDALLYDSESEEVPEEPLDVIDPSCDGVIIDEFIHVGRCKLDVICSGDDLIYDVEGHFQLFSLEQPYVTVTSSDVW